ncbi:MAG: DUF1549 domain-containing protein, partial [Candidatus Hydrogenedentes bacterium]|nr:DUF1549 domain-containing protein [Candidatus Hydrogenedentota bacterium]
AKPANRSTLIRRVSLDPTGLPPSPQELDAFLKDQSPDAYKNLIERLLKSKHFGEHFARYWLDAARYADSNGYFTDNGRDNLGDDVPDCELNRVTEAGQHFGNPYFHAGDVPDPEHGKDKNPDDYTKPVQKLGPHVTPLGLTFYTGDQFPVEYKNRLFIALKGSSNRTIKIGYSIKQITLDKTGNVAKYEDFATGWLYRDEAWGRPVDVQVANDGALLVSDEQAGVIYRIAYTG